LNSLAPPGVLPAVLSLEAGSMMKNLTIKSRLFIAISAVLLCSYSILFFSSYYSIRQLNENEIVKDLQTALKFAKREFGARPEVVLESLKLPASSAPVHGWMRERDRGRLQDALSRWSNSLDFLEMLTIYDGDQNVLVRGNSDSGGKSFLQGDLLRTLYSRRQPIITTELVSREEFCREISADACQALSGNRDVMVQLVLVPVIGGDGRLLGAVVAGDDINKDPHLAYQQQKVFGRTVEMMVTQQGERIASTMPAGDGLVHHLEMKVLQPLKAGFSFNGTTMLNGRSYEMIAEPIQNLNGDFIGSIAVALERGDLVGPGSENFRNLTICALFSLPFIVILAYFTSRQFSIPITRLSETVRSIEIGDYTVRLPQKGAGEFQSIYESCNRLIEIFANRDSLLLGEKDGLVREKSELMAKVDELGRRHADDHGLLAAILKKSGDGLVVTDGDLKVVTINDMGEKLLGMTAAGCMGRSIRQLLADLRLTELEARFATDPLSWQEVDAQPIITTHCGRKPTIACLSLPAEGGGLSGILLVMREAGGDGELDRLKRDFIAIVSHELKTPLTSMKGSLQYILKKGKWLTAAEREMLGVCQRNTERLIARIGSILEISRIESDQITFAKRAINMGELAIYAIEVVKGMALERNISFVNGINFELPQVLGDYDRLQQVLSNLLSNAVKLSPSDSVITLTAERVADFLAVSVCDDGKVIKPDDRERLFSKFQQFSMQEEGDAGGGGLGLAIAREIVEKHGGTISYAPGLAGGNIFTFTVPIYGGDNGQG